MPVLQAVTRHVSPSPCPTTPLPRSRNVLYHSTRNIQVKSRENDRELSMEEMLEECDDIEAEINVADFDNVSVHLTEQQDHEYVL